MKVNKTITNPKWLDEHSIEFGASSWDENEMSVRRRFDPNGKFSPFGSSEISINGFLNISEVYSECLKEDLIGDANLKAVYAEIILSAKRKGITL